MCIILWRRIECLSTTVCSLGYWYFRVLHFHFFKVQLYVKKHVLAHLLSIVCCYVLYLLLLIFAIELLLGTLAYSKLCDHKLIMLKYPKLEISFLIIVLVI